MRDCFVKHCDKSAFGATQAPVRAAVPATRTPRGPEPDMCAGSGKVPPASLVRAYNTPATTLTVMAMMMTLKKNDTMLCSITRRRNDDEVMATSEVWQHMLSTTEK